MRRCLVQACKGICSIGCAERWAHRIMILVREGLLPEHSGTKSALGVACRATILQLAGLESIVRDFNKQFITAVAAANSHRPQTVKFRTQLRKKPLLYRKLAVHSTQASYQLHLYTKYPGKRRESPGMACLASDCCRRGAMHSCGARVSRTQPHQLNDRLPEY